MLRKFKKSVIILLTLSILLSATSLVYADTEESAIIDRGSFTVLLERNVEEKNLDILFDKAKMDSQNNKIKTDENGNIIYQTSQLLAKYQNDDGGYLEEYATTAFHKIQGVEDQDLNISLQSSRDDGKWDNSYSAYMYSIVYYTKVIYNNKECVKLDYCTGGVSQLNSGVSLWNLTVTTGQAGTYSSGTWNQSKTEDFGRSLNFTTYPNSDWKPVEAVFGQYGSLVGCTMFVKLGRSSDTTWSDFFTNRL